MKKAFSLVELSIVLVILGLLVGGILTGQSLIRAAELRSVTTEFSQYQTAVMTFRDKYFAIPGDMKNARDFWGAASNCATAGAVLSGGTCDGNRNGVIDIGGGPSRERYYAWHHLMLAGLIEGNYAGNSGANHVFDDSDAGWNVPQNKLDANGGWCFNHDPVAHDFSEHFDFTRSLGLGPTASASASCTGALMTPFEAWHLDQKMDDGLPGRGKVIGHGTYCTTSGTDPITLDEATGSKYYQGNDSVVRCMLSFINAF